MSNLLETRIKAFEESVICMQFHPENQPLVDEIETDYLKSKQDLLDLFQSSKDTKFPDS